MMSKWKAIQVWPRSKDLFEQLVADAGLGMKRCQFFHRLVVEECARRGIETDGSGIKGLKKRLDTHA